jgi:hypothetical protein
MGAKLDGPPPDGPPAGAAEVSMYAPDITAITPTVAPIIPISRAFS